MKINFKRIDHIQICIPRGEEAKGRKFYCDILGLKEIEKPDSLKKKGGFWVEIADIQIHIGIEETEGTSIRHPAFEVDDLEATKNYLIAKNIKIKENTPIPNVDRFSFYDYWGNRIELLERQELV